MTYRNPAELERYLLATWPPSAIKTWQDEFLDYSGPDVNLSIHYNPNTVIFSADLDGSIHSAEFDIKTGELLYAWDDNDA